MKKIYTGIDIGSDSIKIVVSEIKDENFYVLASTSKRSKGIKQGLVVNKELAIESLNKAVAQVEKQIGVKIDKAVITVPSTDRKLKISEGMIELKEDMKITGKEISKVLESSISSINDNEYEIVTIVPIVFNLDGKDNIFDPKGLTGKDFGVKTVVGSVPKKYLYPFLNVFSECNIEIVDIVFGSIGDYYSARSKMIDRTLGSIINIGDDTVNVSIFNKSILIKNEIINIGSKNIDNDLMVLYSINRKNARFIKEKYAVSNSKYADSNDTIEIPITENEMVTINQEEASKVIETRLVEILKLSKKQINNLTNRKISYIIVTGGITELTGFSNLVEQELGMNAYVINDNIIGIRNNKYSSAAGIIKYFNKKMELREKKYSMFDKDQIDSLMNFKSGNMVPQEKNNSNEDYSNV